MCVWKLLVTIATLFLHKKKIPKNPISRLSHISDSSICKLADLHNVCYKLHALQICICTPESGRIIN